MSYGERLRIRTVCPDSDLPEVRRLYASGLLEGENDPSVGDGDITNLVESYLGDGKGSHFWIAELEILPTHDNDGPRNNHNDQPDPTEREVGELPIPIINYRRNHREIVGMIGALRSDDDTIEIRRLRVDKKHRQRGVGKRLIEEALDFCQDRGYLKVLLDTRVERIPAITLFEQCGFQLTRTRTIEDKLVHEFYLNLYCKHIR